MSADRVKQEKGFRRMDPLKQKELASAGGKAAHASGRARQWNSETAREAGKKGLEARRLKKLNSLAPKVEPFDVSGTT